MISIVVQCIDIVLLNDTHSLAMHWYDIACDKHNCAMHWDCIAYNKNCGALHRI